MRTLWRDDVASFAGEFVGFDRVRVNPKPHEGRQIPIMVGGNSDAALRRAAAGATAGTASTWPAWPTSPTVSPTSTRDAGNSGRDPPCYAVRWRSANRAMVTSRP